MSPWERETHHMHYIEACPPRLSSITALYWFRNSYKTYRQTLPARRVLKAAQAVTSSSVLADSFRQHASRQHVLYSVLRNPRRKWCWLFCRMISVRQRNGVASPARYPPFPLHHHCPLRLRKPCSRCYYTSDTLHTRISRQFRCTIRLRDTFLRWDADRRLRMRSLTVSTVGYFPAQDRFETVEDYTARVIRRRSRASLEMMEAAYRVWVKLRLHAF